MTNNSITIQRVLKTTTEKIYRAFTESNALATWLPPNGFVGVVHTMDVKIGGDYKMSFINFTTGNGHSFSGKYLELKPNEFLKYSNKFEAPNLPCEMITSVWLKKVLVGTEIKIVQENIPIIIPTEMCYLGWQESIEKLTKLVEPVILDAK
ncbi:MAG: SRPBCC family protein [Bacteroidia bacterium]